MNKQIITEQLKAQRQELGKLIRAIGKSRVMKLDGDIFCRNVRGIRRYYVRRSGDKIPRYQSKEDGKLIKDLCTSTYGKRLMDAAQREVSQLDCCIKILESAMTAGGQDKADIDIVYSNLHEGIREHVSPSIYTDDGYAEKWQAEKYQNRWEGKGFKYETPRGERVRSKSEWMIASMLADAGVPYRYEETVGLHELYGGAFHPDFTVLNKRTRKEYYWEHFGRMDDPKYVEESFMPKIIDYYTFGFLPGEKLLMTFESKDHPFDTMQVRRLIEIYLT